MTKAWAVIGMAMAVLGTAACGDGATRPSPGAVVTFTVLDERFKVWLTDDDQIAAAKAAKEGGRARIPNGRIVAGGQVNFGWSWHLEDVSFAQTTIELCDGRPSDVERQGVAFGGGRFCPWTAKVENIDER